MRVRQDLIETFSTFLQFEEDRIRNWVSDPRLQRNMQQRCQQEEAHDQSVQFWVLYWHKYWQKQPESLAKDHLLAYLQEACYWVAHKAGTSFTSSQYGVADCFQLAISHIEKVLKGFNNEQGFDLRKYASAAFSNLIRDHLRQRQEVDICTDWSLLRNVSQKRLVAALDQQGVASSAIPAYLLAWQTYLLLYVPAQATSTRRLSAPQPEMWAAIAQTYNAERQTIASGLEALGAAQIETRLRAMAKAVRAYLYPTTVSMNVTRAGVEDGEYLDNLPELAAPEPLTALIAAEETIQRQQQRQQMSDVLAAAIRQLDAQDQDLLRLYYGDGVSQQQMATQLNLKQYSISRYLSRIKKTLLTALTQWGQDTLHITPSPDVVKHTSAALEEWLSAYYSPSEQP
jgi:RNA polymerase sigma factor (sigma-70 family)